jgi:uncharacterized protein
MKYLNDGLHLADRSFPRRIPGVPVSGKRSDTTRDEREISRMAVTKGHGRGFASMDREKQRLIASKGGKAAHAHGTAHEWTKDEARAAGRKGGMSSRHREPSPKSSS